MWMAWVSLQVSRSMQVQSFLVKRGSIWLQSMMQVSNLQLHYAHAFAFNRHTYQVSLGNTRRITVFVPRVRNTLTSKGEHGPFRAESGSIFYYLQHRRIP